LAELLDGELLAGHVGIVPQRRRRANRKDSDSVIA
jgi:hypothetical protein